MDSIRSHLQSLTHSLPTPIAHLASSILGQDCYSLLVLDLAFLQPPLSDNTSICLKFAISKAIGLAIVFASSIVKLPQIIKLIRSRSAVGVSVSATLLEAASYLIMFAYAARLGFPFSTYGEQSFLFVQDLIIICLLLIYSSSYASLAIIPPAFALATYFLVLASPGPSLATLQALQAATIPLSLASKVPQIFTILREKSTGQLSAVSAVAYLLGSLARLFTMAQEVDDLIVLTGAGLGAVLNFVLFVLMIVYWNSPAKPQTRPSEKEE
ncbi:hypothetical protein BZA70DRAFT_270199 [Myxozyma melibiosi]|uniref:Mannose-P-dolichol utilization defect 1 protein homolog n=1 Tax=Myxozyma melibiosi TaxID=54550 RepID=A0ABR1FB00_9ASCO